MSRSFQVTGNRPGFGPRISHSHRRTKRRVNVNVQDKRYWVPSLGRRVRIRVSPRGIRTIDRRGIDAVVTDLIACGEKFRWRHAQVRCDPRSCCVPPQFVKVDETSGC